MATLVSSGRTALRARPIGRAAWLLRLNLLAAAAFGAVLGFSRLAYGLLLPSIRADLARTSFAALGLVGSANLAGYLLGTLAVPLLLRRVHDRRRVNLIALVGMNLALAGAATSADVVQLAIWRFLNGLASGPAAILIIALTLEQFPVERRGVASGLIWTGGAAGLVVSGPIGPLLQATDLPAWRLAWPAMAVLGLVAALAFHRALGEGTPSHGAAPARPVTAASGAPAELSLWRPPLVWLAVSYFGFGVGYIIYFTFAAALLGQQGAPAVVTSFAWALLGLAGLFGGIGWGRLADGAARLAALPVCLVAAAAGALTVGTGTLGLELAGVVLVGASSFGVPSLATALLRRAIADDRRYTSRLSLLTATVGVGQVLGPLLAGQVSDSGGLVAGTALAGVVLLLAALPAAAYGRSAARRST